MKGVNRISLSTISAEDKTEFLNFYYNNNKNNSDDTRNNAYVYIKYI